MAALFFACGDDDEDGPAPATTPAITRLTPDEGPVGTSVTIAGTNFGTSPTVRFGGTNATVASGATATSLTVTVPGGLTAGEDVDVTVTSGGETSEAVTFAVTEADETSTETPPRAATVVDTIASRDDLNSLEAAITAAGLVETLQGAGPFTVFAPNNAAFTALIESIDGVGSLEELVAAIGEDSLAAILQAHVVSGLLPTDSLMAQAYTTLQGAEIVVAIGEDGATTVDGAAVIETNLLAENGVVHIIDAVINLPEEGDMPSQPTAGTTVVDTIASRDDLNSLEAALTATELVEPLRAEGPFTIFAPNNDAFAELLAAQEVADLPALIEKLGTGVVAEILRAHVVLDSLPTEEIFDNDIYNTLGGASLTVEVSGGSTFVNGAQILETNLVGSNGVVHVIDSVVNLSAGSDGANGFTVTIENVSSEQRFFQQGIFNTPVDGAEAGPIGPGEVYEFTFNAGPVILPNDGGTKLSFVAMLQPSNDLFLATDPNGINLYDANGAISAAGPVDITSQVKVWDAGTEDNETGEEDPTPGPVQQNRTADGLVTITVSNVGTLFTVRIANVSAENAVSPGVYGVHTVNTPIFSTTASARSIAGLELLAEEGDPSELAATLGRNEGFAVPLSSGVYAVHGNITPILVTGTTTRAAGLEALAEEGDPTVLATTLAQNQNIEASGTFGTGNILPGQSVSFTIENVEAGDRLSIAAMMVQSNDIVYSTPENGIPLFVSEGNPIIGNVTNQMVAYDVGTEVNQYPGAGLNQPIRGTGGTDEGGTVERVVTNDTDPSTDGFIYRPVRERIRVTITPN